MVPPAITGTRPSTDSGRHFLFHPGALVHKFQSKREAEFPPVLNTLEKDGRVSGEGDGCAIMDDNASSEVDEVILVRKLGSISSLRERRTKVLRQLEMVSHEHEAVADSQAHVELAQRILSAVRSHKARFFPTPHLIELLRARSGLMAMKMHQDAKLPPGITKTQRLDLLTKALADYVDDEDAQVGKTDLTVWDVSRPDHFNVQSDTYRYYIRSHASCLIHTKPSLTSRSLQSGERRTLLSSTTSPPSWSTSRCCWTMPGTKVWKTINRPRLLLSASKMLVPPGWHYVSSTITPNDLWRAIQCQLQIGRICFGQD
jgi:hypothetical protein